LRNGSLNFALRSSIRGDCAAWALSNSVRHYPLVVILHTTWIIGLLILGHDRVIDPFWLSVFIVLQIGRLWVIGSLSRRWTTRVIVLPGAATIARGPYR
jgi:methyltransferase